MIARRPLFLFGLFCLTLAVCLNLTACSGASFLTDLEGVLPTVGLAVTGILSILGSVTGNPELTAVAALVNPILTRIQINLTDAQELQAEYKQTAQESTLEQIEALIPAIQQDLDALPATDGLPADVAAKVKAVTDVVLPGLASLLSSLPVLKPSTAGQTLTVTKPAPATEFKAKVQAAIGQ